MISSACHYGWLPTHSSIGSLSRSNNCEEEGPSVKVNFISILFVLQQNHVQHTTLDRRHSRNSSSSSVFSLTDTMTRSLSSGGTAVLEELQATIRHKEGELVSMQVGDWV